MLVLNKFLLISLFFIFSKILAKDQIGDSFRVYHKPTFPQSDFVKQLNSLQVLATIISEEPLFKSEKSMINTVNNFKKLLAVFPEFTNFSENIFLLDSSRMHSGESKQDVWSYHSFPTYKGSLAYRYLDPFFEKNESWEEMFQYYEKNLPQYLIDNNKSKYLSPIEKFEYLIGNSNFKLTNDQWAEGQKYLLEHGAIPDWFGLCNGTAPASINNVRPINAIFLKSFDDKSEIIFYPSDLKALIAFAWAANGGASEIMGSRCESVINPELRPGMNCLDTNPGAFHLATLNLIGLNSQSFIIDSASGNEVWNRSITSYKYKYFRPGTRHLTDNIKYAILPINEYKNDPYAAYRTPGTSQIVGVHMESTYLIGTKPSSHLIDSKELDLYEKANYRYDLEIDQTGKIIGGEWYEIIHPDFVWVVAKNYFPKTSFDDFVGSSFKSYDGKQPLSVYQRELAQKASNEGKLLYSLLDAMLKLSTDEKIIKNNFPGG